MKQKIRAFLCPEYPWAENLHWYDSISSTNDHIKQMARQGAPHGTVVIADQQSNGHGRLGRSFQSPVGMGVYMSILLRPQCLPTELMHLTCAAAVAMCDAVEAACGIRPGIKWTNDLVHQGKKLGGILTELGLTPQGTVSYAIIGIGINCNQTENDFPPEIRNIAHSLSMVTGREEDRFLLAAAMMEALWKLDITQKEAILTKYRRDCITIGQEISLVRGEEIRHGKAIDVDNEGALIVLFPDGHMETVNSGEVSVRGMYGYV